MVYPKHNNNKEKRGIDIVSGIVTNEFDFIWRSQANSDDYGTDGIIEITENQYVLGKSIAVQIKYGESWFNEVKDNCFIVRESSQKHYHYWLDNSLPHIFIITNGSDDAYWVSLNEDSVIRTEKGLKIKIPRENEFLKAKKEIGKLAKYDKLNFIKSNSEIIKCLKAYIEGDCKVVFTHSARTDKTYGGEYKLFVEDEDSVVVENLDYVLMPKDFNFLSMEKFLMYLFPWADVSIDEEYYEIHEETDPVEKCKQEYGFYDKETGEYYYELDDVYWNPYRPYEDGLVESYRFLLQPNKLADAILLIEEHMKSEYNDLNFSSTLNKEIKNATFDF